jgi:putative radical SAM enzyme (TIGR03279 family)
MKASPRQSAEPRGAAPLLCGRLTNVADGSPAARAGLRAGDCLLTINGRPVRDVIDVQFFSADEHVQIEFLRHGQRHTARLERPYGQEPGWEFAELVFDGLRECENHCPFCFVRQMPAGLRRSLYVYDDDYRYSFLHGSFVTLTNLGEADWQRIEEQHLSPLYVSVHATEPALRERLLGRRGIPPIMEQLRRLIALGIALHTQIVVVPGLNDKQALASTVADLAGLYPGVQSIGVVPVGLTRYGPRRLRRNSTQEALQLLAQVTTYHEYFRRRLRRGLVYASDEWYLMADLPIPPAGYYDDYPQLENGIGLTRQLLEDWAALDGRLRRRAWAGGPIGIVCGMLIAPTLRTLLTPLSEQTGVPAVLLPVENRFFGAGVNVSGLLTGGDVVAALGGQTAGLSRLFLPRSMFNAEGVQTLDDWTLERIGQSLGTPAAYASQLSELTAAL